MKRLLFVIFLGFSCSSFALFAEGLSVESVKAVTEGAGVAKQAVPMLGLMTLLIVGKSAFLKVTGTGRSGRRSRSERWKVKYYSAVYANGADSRSSKAERLEYGRAARYLKKNGHL